MRNVNTRYNAGLRYIEGFSRNPVVFNNFYNRAIRQWNKLKVSYTLIDCPKKFKEMIKKDHPDCYTLNPGITF